MHIVLSKIVVHFEMVFHLNIRLNRYETDVFYMHTDIERVYLYFYEGGNIRKITFFQIVPCKF